MLSNFPINMNCYIQLHFFAFTWPNLCSQLFYYLEWSLALGEVCEMPCNGIATASVDLHGSHAYNLVKL